MSAVMKEQSQTIGSKIDQLKELRNERLTLEKQVKSLKECEEVLVLEVIDVLDSQDTTMGRGRVASASIVEEDIATVEDYDAFYEHIVSEDRPYLLQRRVAQGAVKELLESGEEVPGIKLLTKRKLSLRKV
jgi:hypothetical protein